MPSSDGILYSLCISIAVNVSGERFARISPSEVIREILE
jgi:hypothetical protein